MRRCSCCHRLLVRRSKLSARLCTPCAEGASAVASAEGSEARVRGRLYGAVDLLTRSVNVDAAAGRQRDRTGPI